MRILRADLLWWMVLANCCWSTTSSDIRIFRKCYSDTQFHQTLSCMDSAGDVLEIRNVFIGVGRQQLVGFCENPINSTEDCMLNNPSITETYRIACNGFPTCSIERHTPNQDCGQEFLGDMYLYIEYVCQSANIEHARTTGCLPVSSNVTASTVVLRSAEYPAYDFPFQCSCRATPTAGYRVQVNVRDVIFFDPDDACSLYVTLGPNRTMCLRRGDPYRSVVADMGHSPEFKLVSKHNVSGRYLIGITTDPPGGMITVFSAEQVHLSALGDIMANKSLNATEQSTLRPGSTSPPARNGSINKPIIIGGAIAGGFLAVLIITLALCFGRKKPTPMKQRGDLGYMVHANPALANKTSSQLTRQASATRASRGSAGKAAVQIAQHSVNLKTGDSQYAKIDEVRRSSRSRPAHHPYENIDDFNINRKPKSAPSHRKSASQTMLTATLESGSSAESLDRLGVRTCYVVDDFFASFPQWKNAYDQDNPRNSGHATGPDSSPCENTFVVNTLPAKLNKKPMPLPKPKRHKSTLNISPDMASSLGLGRSADPTTSSSSTTGLSQAGAQSTLSLSPSEQFGTTSSTAALYAVPNKQRRNKDVTIVENDLYGARRSVRC